MIRAPQILGVQAGLSVAGSDLPCPGTAGGAGAGAAPSRAGYPGLCPAALPGHQGQRQSNAATQAEKKGWTPGSPERWHWDASPAAWPPLLRAEAAATRSALPAGTLNRSAAGDGMKLPSILW